MLFDWSECWTGRLHHPSSMTVIHFLVAGCTQHERIDPKSVEAVMAQQGDMEKTQQQDNADQMHLTFRLKRKQKMEEDEFMVRGKEGEDKEEDEEKQKFVAFDKEETLAERDEGDEGGEEKEEKEDEEDNDKEGNKIISFA
ncbi:uncharacterized protein MONOS_18067 [Monocercomonoides exilis]|uniref:uncharacterized protein n=1 Tax=Monocercomonoides exilis TaxID=2049356 RepID=UPI00355A9DC1|nr:hypothetical protein MONOS_18067 [Monocercomonoides exilis]